MSKVRRSKSVTQQCKHYEVENIFEYMVSVYINGNFAHFQILYRELRTDDRRLFISYLFDEVTPDYQQEIIIATI